ncbi:MAG: VOC family protein [Candidatus Aenigmarchaeota archaeon]|nr:VOC family protein [Candidatus Aenigmarchaeota archaeon]
MTLTGVKKVIGDYEIFFSDLLHRLKGAGIDVKGMPMSHLLYRTTTVPEYEKIRDQLKTFCKEFAETQFNGRAVSILVLKNTLVLEDGFTVSVIELPAPRPAHMYPSGLESIGIIVGDELPEFNKKYENKLTGIKDHGIHCKPSFITFDNGKTAKFYEISLQKIVELQGWQFEKLSGIRGGENKT